MKDAESGSTAPHQAQDRFTLLTIGASIIMLLFLTVPLVALLLRAISSGTFGVDQIDLRILLNAITISLITTTIAGAIILLLGTPLALLLARYQFPLKSLISVLVELPIVMPPVVAGLALLLAFGRRGLFGPLLGFLKLELAFTPLAVIIAQVFVASPFYIRAAQIHFQSIPIELMEAAEIDGATGYRSFRRVILPLSWPALLAGFILSWARALGEFGATILFAGNLQGSTQTMPLLVYAALEQNLDAAILTGAILIGVAASSMVLVQLLTAGARSQPAQDQIHRQGRS